MKRLATWVPQNASYIRVLPGLEQKEKAFAVFRAGLVQTHEAPKHNAFHFFSSSPSLSFHRAEIWQYIPWSRTILQPQDLQRTTNVS